MIGSRSAAALLLLLSALPAAGQKVYVYVGDIGPDFVLLAWGRTNGNNTIGRTASPMGRASVKVGEQTATVTDRNWTVVRGLQPDTEYAYEVTVGGVKAGAGKTHTWPRQADKLCFFVIGDWGNASSLQYQVADAMRKEYLARERSCPIRFVITTGDNIYGLQMFAFGTRGSGRYDYEWEQKFFQPYERILQSVPFYPSLGNHDGNESENRADLSTYLDNFFFSGFAPARYYRFSFGGLVDFFSLDSTMNTESGNPRASYAPDSDQHKWLMKNLAESEVPWKIPYFHHPPFNAGPRHPPSNRDLAHFLKLFRQHGVRVVFTGHEHNFQYSEQTAATADMRFIVTGAGGELRTGDVRSAMERSRIEGWAPQAHFVHVEIDKKEMRITPLSYSPVVVYDRDGGTKEMPLKVNLP